MTRVAVVINGLETGGAERLVFELLRRHGNETGWTYFVVSLGRGGELADAVRELGHTVVELGASCRLDPAPIWHLARLLTSQGIDLVHAHLPRAGVIARIAATVARVPVLYTEHNVWSCYHPVARLLNRLTLPLCSVVAAVSEGVRRSMGAVGRSGRVVVIRNGLDLSSLRARVTRKREEMRELLGVPQDAFVVSNVANVRPEKGHDVLMAAAESVCRRLGKAHFVLVGLDFGQRRILDVEIESRGLLGRVHYLGYREDVPDLLEASDLFVLPSLWEGMPIALLEAQALGKAAVVTAVGGNCEVVRNGRTGVVVPARQPELLAEAIVRLAQDDVTRLRLGQAGRERVEREFSLNQTAARYHRLYEQLAAKRR